jgi:STE24 endopeptidase
MDILHTQLAVIQHRLAFVQEDPIDWRTYVLVFSWGICFFESYLLYVFTERPFSSTRSRLCRLRQYPLYSKLAPPSVLAEHFKIDVFEKSQKYGKHKAKFSIVSGLYKQVIDTLQLASGVYYPWAWSASGQLLGLAGYGPEYLVCPHDLIFWIVVSHSTLIDFSVGFIRLSLNLHFRSPNFASRSVSNLRA